MVATPAESVPTGLIAELRGCLEALGPLRLFNDWSGPQVSAPLEVPDVIMFVVVVDDVPANSFIVDDTLPVSCSVCRRSARLMSMHFPHHQ